MSRIVIGAQWLDVQAKRFVWIAWALLALVVVSLVHYALDRNPPFGVISTEPAAARAGDYITLRSSVHRDTQRRCSAEYSRFIFASDGSRYELDTQQVDSDFIDRLQARTPNALIITFLVPAGIAPGPASLETAIRYRCNKTQLWWPIEVATSMPFTVLAP